MLQVRDKEKLCRDTRTASRAAEKLLLDPPPTDRIALHVRPVEPYFERLGLCSCRHHAVHAVLALPHRSWHTWLPVL